MVRNNELKAAERESIPIKNNTKIGYLLAYEGDGIDISGRKNHRGTVQKGMAQTLKTQCDVGVVIGTYEWALSKTFVPTLDRRVHIGKNESGTIISTGNNNGVIMKDNSNLRIRKLTSKECYRLMGFCKRQPDGTFDDTDYEKARSVNSESQLYKQAGNSIVVDVLEAIFKDIL